MAGYYETRTLLEAQRQMPPVQTFLRDRFTLPGKTFPTKTVEIEYKKGKRRIAPYVSDLLPGKVISRDGRTVKVIEPALIKPARNITVVDINQRGFGEALYSDRTPEERAEELLAEDMIELDDYITRREEVALSELIFTGKVTQIGEGVSQVIDYNLTNKEILTGTAVWTNAASKPIADLVRWKKAVTKNSGSSVAQMIGATDAIQAFIDNPEIQNLFDKRNFQLGSVSPRPPVDGATYIGYLSHPGIEIWSYDDWYLDDTDTEQPMIPLGYIALLPAAPTFRIHYGAITLMGENHKHITIEGARVPHVWSQMDPAITWLQTHAKPLPVPTNVDSWFVAKVTP